MMPVGQRPRILDILQDHDDLAADQALVAGALHVQPEHQREIIAILLKRAREPGLRALPALFDSLDAESQSMILESTSDLFAALRVGICSSRSRTRVNTLEIIRRSGSLRLAYLAAIAIHDGSPKVRADAAVTLQQLAEKHCRDHDDIITALREAPEPDGAPPRATAHTLRLLHDERKYLVAAIDEALNSYESHHRPEVVEAAMFIADELEKCLFEQSTLKRGKLTHAMLEIFTGSLQPRLAPFTYVALCYPELRRRVAAILSKHQDSAFFAEFIRYHWLTRDPAIRKNLVAFRHLAWLDDGLEAAFSLPADVAAMAPPWLLPLGLPSDQKVSLLLNFLLLDNLPANRAAVCALLKINTPASTLALQSVLDHEDPELVKIAQREIRFREHRQQKLVRRPHKARPEAWSNMLGRAGLSEDFDELWHHFDRLHPVLARNAGHHAVKYIPSFMTQVQVKLLSPHAADRLRALRFIIILHVGEKFQKDIYSIANDPAPEIRAVAMTALGHIGEATSRRILERALSDEDPNVQANAIDALDCMGAKHRADLIIPKTASDEPSVRAAAIRTLLKMQIPQSATALIAMLRDPRAEHRCAALWIIEQLRIVSVASRVKEIEEHDRDPRIARIAQHVGKRLKRLLRSPAGPVKREAAGVSES
jgi:HEAT repeat protein